MKSLIFFLSLVVLVAGISSPVEKSSPSPSFYGDDKTEGGNADNYESYGLPPDFYPALIPSDYDTNPDFYYNPFNLSYNLPIISDEKGCSSVESCPDHQFDPYAPVYGIAKDDPNAPLEFSREWKCHVETNCVALDEIPTDIQNDTEVLFLRYFNISVLQDGALSFLPPLMKLHIESSELAILERGAFKNQKSLQYLELPENLIEELQPLIFVELDKLQRMEVTDNFLTRLDKNAFKGLKSLTVLKLGGNKLRKMDDDVFEEISGLEELHLDDNNITSFSRHAFRGLTKLTALHLSDNYFSKVPNLALRSLPSLEILHLTGNPLTQILKADFRHLDTLKELRLDQCDITSISKRALRGKNLTFLDLSDNKLTKLSDFGFVGKKLALQMAFNPWMCNCSLTAMTSWIAHYGVSILPPEPRCHAPFYMMRRRITDLTDKQLCDPTAIPPPLKPGEENNDTDTSLPDGRWSNEVYNIEKLYPKIDRTTLVTQSSVIGNSVTRSDIINHPITNDAWKNGPNEKAVGTAKNMLQTFSKFPKSYDVNAEQTKSQFEDTSSVEPSATTDAQVRLIADHITMVVLIVGVSIPIFLIVVLILHNGVNKTPCTEKSDIEMPDIETKCDKDKNQTNGREEVARDGAIRLPTKAKNEKPTDITNSFHKKNKNHSPEIHATKQPTSLSSNDSPQLSIPAAESGQSELDGIITTGSRTDEIFANRHNSQ